MNTVSTTELVDKNLKPWGPTAILYVAAFLWLSNVSWKVPPSFGRSADSCNRLCGFVADGVAHPVFWGSPWFFEHIVSPHLGVFGWYTLAIESTIIALLFSGRFLRIAGVLGIIQSIGIMSAVANTPGEWYWSYILMAALSFTIILFAPTLRPTPTKVMAVLVALYGVIVAVARARSGFTGSGDGSRILFGGSTSLPDNFGRNAFPGSIALGLILIAMGVITWFLVDLTTEDVRRVIGWVVVAFGVLLLVTYSSDGTIIGLGSKASTAAVIAALGLSLVPWRSPTRSGDSSDPLRASTA